MNGLITLESYLLVAAALFCLGVACALTRRNAIGVLIGIELILNAANLNFIAFDRHATGLLSGQAMAIFIIILAACEAAIALAIIIAVFQNFGTIDIDATDDMKG